MAPPRRDTEPVLLTLHRKSLSAIQTLIDADPDKPTRQDVIRRIIEEWFAAKGIDVRE